MPRVDNWRDQIEKELVTGCYEIKIADLERQLEAEREMTTALKAIVERLDGCWCYECRQSELAALSAPEAGA